MHSGLHFSFATLTSFRRTGKASFFTTVAISSPSISIFSASRGHMIAHSPQRIQESTSKSIVGFLAKHPATTSGGFHLMASLGQFSAHTPHPSHKFLFKRSRYSLVRRLRSSSISLLLRCLVIPPLKIATTPLNNKCNRSSDLKNIYDLYHKKQL